MVCRNSIRESKPEFNFQTFKNENKHQILPAFFYIYEEDHQDHLKDYRTDLLLPVAQPLLEDLDLGEVVNGDLVAG